MFFRHRGRKGPVLFPVLYILVEILADIRAQRRSQNAAGTQGTRAKLHPPLKPAQDTVRPELLYGGRYQVIVCPQIAEA